MYLSSHILISFAIIYSLNISNEIYIKLNQSRTEYRGFCEHNVDYILIINSYKRFIIIPEQFCGI